MTRKIIRVGNSIGVTFGRKLASQFGFIPGCYVDVKLGKRGEIIIKKKKTPIILKFKAGEKNEHMSSTSSMNNPNSNFTYQLSLFDNSGVLDRERSSNSSLDLKGTRNAKIKIPGVPGELTRMTDSTRIIYFFFAENINFSSTKRTKHERGRFNFTAKISLNLKKLFDLFRGI